MVYINQLRCCQSYLFILPRYIKRKHFMPSYRQLSRLPLITSRRIVRPTTTRKMSLFPRAFVGSDPSFTPLFRLLDDFDSYSKGAASGQLFKGHVKTFQPKFDVKEVADSYELHGELPGIEQKDVEIEFTDAQTLTIKGRTERTYTAGTPPFNLVEDAKTSGAITEGDEQKDSHQPTVEDEDAAKKSDAVVAAEAPKEEPQQEQVKYWVSERSVGEFARSFSFPARVDQDAVKASMKNGILTVIVPKAKKLESRKITIS